MVVVFEYELIDNTLLIFYYKEKLIKKGCKNTIMNN